ncbi:MAG: hypothetical protein HY908_03985 [Myxococcales bacterium]|nr:hypothetical protein [Myxococcales bacterium]
MRTCPVTPELLDAVARFGNPGSWAFLAHHLADPELQHAAAAALTTLFGDPAETKPLAEGGWEATIGRLRLDPDRRYRRGKHWSPDVVTEECRAGELCRLATERRLDELRASGARRGAAALPSVHGLHGWGASVSARE